MTEKESEVFEEWMRDKGLEITGKGTVYDRGRRKYDTSRIVSLWTGDKGLLKDKYFMVDEDEVQSLIQGIAESQRQANEESRASSSSDKPSPQEIMLIFTDRFLSEFELKLISNTPIIFKRGGRYQEQVGLKDSAKETRISLIQDAMPTPKLEDSVAYVEQIYREFVREQREKALDVIKYNPNVKARGFSFKGWTIKVFEFYGIENKPLNRKMWRYFMHSIKRAAFGMRPNDMRIFFLIYSRTQGIGKSRLLAHLCDPFAYAFNNAVTLDDFLDKSSVKALTKGAYALLDFQELGTGKGASSVSASDFGALMKRVVTLDVEKGRELYTTTDTASLMNMVFSSSTNLHISDVVQDTEYRRYFSFDSSLTKDEAIDRDWSEVDEFFATTLADAYAFLDEEEIPVLDKETLAELREVQSTYRRRTDIVTQWMRDIEMTLLNPDSLPDSDYEKIEKNALYRKFCTFCTMNGFPRMSIARMQQLISASLDILADDRKDGKSYYYLQKVVVEAENEE